MLHAHHSMRTNGRQYGGTRKAPGLGSGLESWSVVRVRVRLGVRVRVGPSTYLRGRHVRSRSSAAARAAGELNESSRAGAEGGWCGLEEGARADCGPTRRSPQQPRRRSRAVRSEAAGPDARGLRATTRLGPRCVRCTAPSSRVTISGRGWLALRRVAAEDHRIVS